MTPAAVAETVFPEGKTKPCVPLDCGVLEGRDGVFYFRFYVPNTQQGEGWAHVRPSEPAGWLTASGHAVFCDRISENLVMVNFLCQLGWAQGRHIAVEHSGCVCEGVSD